MESVTRQGDEGMTAGKYEEEVQDKNQERGSGGVGVWVFILLKELIQGRVQLALLLCLKSEEKVSVGWTQ